MSLRKYRQRLKIIDHHISTMAAGNIQALAYKLGLSISGAYQFLDEMKEEGFPIKYSKKENYFYYHTKGKMVGYVFVKDTDGTDNDSIEKIRGGGVKIF